MDDETTTLDAIGQTPPMPCPVDEAPLQVEAERTTWVGFDNVEQLPVSQIAPLLRDASMDHMVGAATLLAEQGGRGAAARRLLARDIELLRVQLRWYEGLLAREMKTGTEKRIKQYLQLVNDLHHRMLASLELLARIESPAPVVQVRAQQAAVLIERETK